MYELYKNDYSHIIPFANNDSIKVFCEKITVKGYGWKETLLWNLATLGKVKVYAVYDKNRRIHTSYVVRGREKFLFLGKSDIEIGPCWTNSEYRGRGIYPMVLSSIIKNELSGGGTAYMIIHKTNNASQHGVAKIGFSKTGHCVKKDLLKRYGIE